MTAEFKMIFIKIKSVILGFIVPLVCFVVSVILITLIIVPAIKTFPANTREVNNKQGQINILKNKMQR